MQSTADRPNSRGRRGKSDAKTSGPRRRRSTSRRRLIEAEVRKRDIGNTDVFSLQERLASGGAGEQLMEAARGLLRAVDYDNVVLERSVEGLCGFPPCENAAAGSQGSKKLNINTTDRHVYNAKEVGRFCCRDCLSKSGEFALRLAPEPAYIRSAAAVASSRGAVAQSQELETAEVSEPGNAQATVEPAPAAEDASANVASSAPQGKKPLPKVRQKAVVRFSREQNNYTVNYADYDGGGHIPGLPSAAETLTAPTPARNEFGTETDDKGAAKEPKNLADIMTEHVSEKKTVNFAGTETVTIEATATDSSNVIGTEDVADGDDVASNDDSLFGDSFLETDQMNATDIEKVRPESSFVRCWGVLTSWWTDLAREVLAGMPAPMRDDEEDPLHAQRRLLLGTLLLDRVPADLTLLSPKLGELVTVLGIHQVVPPISDTVLWDLASAVLHRAIFEASVRAGTDLPTAQYLEGITEFRLSTAAKAANISDEELTLLKAVVLPK